MDWAVFSASALAVVVAGSLLARFADAVSTATGIGALWFGAVVVALVTSLPELVTDISAVRQGNANLALGDLFGSSMSNMAILAFVTLAFSSRRLLQRVALENVLTGSLAMAVTTMALLFMLVNPSAGVDHVGIGPLAVFAAYLVGTVAIRERQTHAPSEEREFVGLIPLKPAVIGFVATALVILVSGPFLADSSAAIAAETGLGTTFFGTVFVALVTSLPELTVSISAMRLGALNLVLGNLMGSNATNMAILFPLDLLYREGRLLSAADAALPVAGLVAILLMTIGVAAIVLKSERQRMPFDTAAALMLVCYALGLVAVYDATRG